MVRISGEYWGNMFAVSHTPPQYYPGGGSGGLWLLLWVIHFVEKVQICTTFILYSLFMPSIKWMSSLWYNLQEVHLPICSQEIKLYILGFKYTVELLQALNGQCTKNKIRDGTNWEHTLTPTYITTSKLQVQHWIQFSELFSILKTRCKRVFTLTAGY